MTRRPALRAMRRDANEPEIVTALEAAACDVHRLNFPCDLLVGRAGSNYLLEVKTDKGKLTEDEKRFGDWWRGTVTVVRTPEEALKAVGL